MEIVAQRGIILELCPTSNVLTKSISSPEAYPIRQIRAAGVRVCINADDPGVFDYDLNHEYGLLARFHGLTEPDFAAMNRDALESSFIRDDLKRKAISNADGAPPLSVGGRREAVGVGTPRRGVRKKLDKRTALPTFPNLRGRGNGEMASA
jgi:adenosine deaminase